MAKKKPLSPEMMKEVLDKLAKPMSYQPDYDAIAQKILSDPDFDPTDLLPEMLKKLLQDVGPDACNLDPVIKKHFGAVAKEIKRINDEYNKITDEAMDVFK